MHIEGAAQARRALLWLLLLLAAAVPGHSQSLGSDLSVGGDLALTSDYIYRGLSESGGDPAAQADLHVNTAGGTYLGVWASTRENDLAPYANYDVQLYLGHRFDLNDAWAVTVDARGYYYVGGTQEVSDDYQQISASLSYRDTWTLSLTAIPNAVRYWYDERLGRSPAWVVDTSAQWLIRGGLFLTGGAGYYYATGTGPGIQAATGYAYGNAGVAFEYRHWRLDVGYFLTQQKAQQLFPYPTANQRLAATLLWRF